jgi:uncharacterized protein involved in outer membrane biogenesis
MKIFKWIVIVVVLLIVAVVAFVFLNIDHIIKTTVQTQGSEQLKVPTNLDGVSLSLLGGTLDLNHLTIGSPQGFSAPEMLALGGLKVDTGGLSNLRKEPIHVSTIVIDQPKLVIEQAGGKLNFKALMDNLPSNPDQNPPAQTGEKPPVKLIIDDLAVNNAQVVVRPGIPGLSQEIAIPIPSISVKNIGNADGAQNGAAIKDVVTTLITQMTAKAADSDKLPPEVKVLLSGDLNAIKDKLTQAASGELNKVTEQLKGKIPASLPANIGGLLNNAGGGGQGGQPSSGGGGNNTAQNLLNQGFGALRGATSQPAK